MFPLPFLHFIVVTKLSPGFKRISSPGKGFDMVGLTLSRFNCKVNGVNKPFTVACRFILKFLNSELLPKNILSKYSWLTLIL